MIFKIVKNILDYFKLKKERSTKKDIAESILQVPV